MQYIVSKKTGLWLMLAVLSGMSVKQSSHCASSQPPRQAAMQQPANAISNHSNSQPQQQAPMQQPATAISKHSNSQPPQQAAMHQPSTAGAANAGYLQAATQLTSPTDP